MTVASFVIITNKNNQILLQHRDGGAPTNPNKWQLWGGAVEKGETPAQTLIRELKEELDMNITPDEIIFLKNYSAGNAGEVAVSLIRIKDIGKFTLGEGDGLGFFNKEAVDTLDLEEITRAALKDHFSN